MLREAERRWQSLLDNVQLIVVGLDLSGNINLDLSPNGIDELLFLKQLRTQPETQKISVVLLAAKEKWFDLRLFQQYQVAAAIVNPLSATMLPVQIANVLGWNLDSQLDER